MERLVRGDIVVIEFPFSDLKNSKKRPVLILKIPHGEDLIALQITGTSYEKNMETELNKNDFKKGFLKRESFVRIDKVASIEKSLINYKIGSLKKEKFEEIIEKFTNFIKDKDI